MQLTCRPCVQMMTWSRATTACGATVHEGNVARACAVGEPFGGSGAGRVTTVVSRPRSPGGVCRTFWLLADRRRETREQTGDGPAASETVRATCAVTRVREGWPFTATHFSNSRELYITAARVTPPGAAVIPDPAHPSGASRRSRARTGHRDRRGAWSNELVQLRARSALARSW